MEMNEFVKKVLENVRGMMKSFGVKHHQDKHADADSISDVYSVTDSSDSVVIPISVAIRWQYGRTLVNVMLILKSGESNVVFENKEIDIWAMLSPGYVLGSDFNIDKIINLVSIRIVDTADRIFKSHNSFAYMQISPNKPTKPLSSVGVEWLFGGLVGVRFVETVKKNKIIEDNTTVFEYYCSSTILEMEEHVFIVKWYSTDSTWFNDGHKPINITVIYSQSNEKITIASKLKNVYIPYTIAPGHGFRFSIELHDVMNSIISEKFSTLNM